MTEVWLISLTMHLVVGATVPQDLIAEIYSFTGTHANYHIQQVFFFNPSLMSVDQVVARARQNRRRPPNL